jgi:hypothetical protein
MPLDNPASALENQRLRLMQSGHIRRAAGTSVRPTPNIVSA